MKLYVVASIISICLLSSFTGPVLAQMGGGPMGGQQMGMRGKAFDMMQQGMGLRAEQGMRGLGFMHSAGNAFGEFVTFTVDNQTGKVMNYGISGIPLFDIGVAGFNYGTTSRMGPLTRVSNDDGSIFIQLHDNPAGVINILANRSISVTFTLADGVTAEKEDNFVRIESGDVIGYIVGMGTVTSSISGTQVRVDAPPNSAVVFRASPVNMPMFDHMYRRFSQEIARNRLGMEVAFGRNRTYNAINYSAGMHLRVQAMDQDRIRLMINATDPAGRLIGINLDNSSLRIRERDRLRIHYDGTPLQCADNPNIVFNGTNTPLCWVSPIQERTRAQLMVYVPNFSVHTIDIVVEPGVTGTPTVTGTPITTVTTMPPAVTTPTPETPGFEFMVSLAGLLAVFSLKRRRN